MGMSMVAAWGPWPVSSLTRIRHLLGVLLKDLPRVMQALRFSGRGRKSHPQGWASLCNRGEAMDYLPDRGGFLCRWQWGSELHAASVIPYIGRRVLRSALDEWPITFASESACAEQAPVVSFVIAFSGSERLGQLKLTIQSLFAQEGVACEIIVVDQSEAPMLAMLPTGITYIHLSRVGLDKGWYKSWAFNIGARVAGGRILVFHDGDVCAPVGYAREIVRALDPSGVRAASLQRFLFYLSESRTKAACRGRTTYLGDADPVSVFQNWKGGTIAVERDAFFEVGGFDEGFVDWGGEDDEFFDRCAALGHDRAGLVPFVHLWHPPQQGRDNRDAVNTRVVLPRRLALDRTERISELTSRNWGSRSGPDPKVRYG